MLSAPNVFPQDENTYITGTPWFYEKLEVSLEILIENNEITAIIICKNNTGFNVYVPNQYIDIFTNYEGKKIATNNFFLIYNQNNEIAEYYGFGTKFSHDKENSVLLKNNDYLTIKIEHLEEIYIIPNGTSELFISYYSTIAPPSNTVQVEYRN